MLAYLRLELLRSIRNRRFIFFVGVFPVGLYLLFTKVVNTASDAHRADNVRDFMIAMAAYGALSSAIMQTGPRLAMERLIGWNRQLRLTPLSDRAALAVKVISSMVLSIPALVLVTAVGRLANHVQLSPGARIATVALMWLGTAPFAALGVAIGYLVDGESAQLASMLCFFILTILGGLWIPTSQFPTGLRRFAEALPSYRYGDLGWHSALGHAPPLADLVVILAYTAVFAAAGVYAYRRAVSRGTA